MTATYRLQLHAGFTFADAEAVTPYLRDLGVTHLYLSPVLQAVPGSQHGYDVLDHSQISHELGGMDGLLSLAATARDNRLGIVLDVVPNHMALVAPEIDNQPLWDVLAHGRDAAHAHWFDVDWDALGGRIGLPVLWDSLDDVLAGNDLRFGEERGAPVIRYHDHVFPVADGTWDGEPGADVAEVLERQHYRLGGWRERDEVLNYRRFFDVDGLIAIRVEHADVFEATHRLLLDLNQKGIVEGFRIDHPDGLADPEGYLDRLRGACLPGTAIWVEKILEGEEQLPAWPCDGTTGYDANTAITAALVDAASSPALSYVWESLGGDPSLEHVVEESKRTIVDNVLVPERARLVRRAGEMLPDAEPDRLAAAVAELLVACTVYRAYVRPGEPADDLARRRFEDARRIAVAARPDLDAELTELVEAMSAADTEAARDFVIRLQQTWGPVMAKGIEDTAFYRWHRLVALNEVGGDPGMLDEASPERLHAWATHQQKHWPLGMTSLSTHDTKRSEDVRARVLAVAGDGESWHRCADAFAEAAAGRHVDGQTAHLVWQTIVGAGEIDHDRLSGYLTKALRESKQRTSWLESDPDYELQVLGLARDALGEGRLADVMGQAVHLNREAVRLAVLAQKLLQLTLPGVPDTYQGCELVDLSLVDPDNRRPVDFAERHRRLTRLADHAPEDLHDEKLLVTHKALMLRKELPDCFGDAGDYQPLVGTSRHLVGFLRGGEVATLVSRACQRLDAAGGWDGAQLVLPEGLWRDELTGVMYGGADNLLDDVFARFPVALLRRIHLS